MKPKFLVVAAVAAVAACYQAPSPVAASDVIDVRLPKQPLAADGASVASLTVHIDPDTAAGTSIELNVSDGIVDFAADPASVDARKLTFTFGGAADMTVPFRVGRTPGDLLVRAKAGDIVSSGVIQLGASAPASLALTVDRNVVPADGLTPVNVTATLRADDGPRRVSFGSAVHFAVCCTVGGAAAPCAGSPPFQVPESGLLAADDAVSVRGLAVRSAARGDGGVDGDELVVIVASAGAASRPTCDASPDGPLRQSAAIRITEP